MALSTTACAPHNEPKAFQFIEGRPPSRAQASGKENETVFMSAQNEVETLKAPLPPLNKSTSEPFPSTPSSGRIPLADLIGDAERTHTALPQAESPQEHVLWHTVRSPIASQTVTTPARRAKKRAKSSSPPTSSIRATSKRHKPETEPLDLNSIAKTLKTPVHDPAADLWNRYAIGTSKDTPLGLHASAFSHLLDSSSPQVDDPTSGNVKGLRRWTSCGVEWPSSKAKRRKIRPSNLNEQIEEDIFTDAHEDPQLDGKTAKPSKISTMLERIQQSLLKEQNPAQHPSSSSPVPERHETFDRKSISPQRAPELAELVQKKSTSGANRSDSTSFGSDDLSSDMLEEVVKQEEQLLLRLDEASSKVQHDFVGNGNSAMSADDSDDEYGGTNDFDVGEFDKVVAQCTQAPVSVPGHRRPTPEEETFGFDDDDDDDIDEATLVAAELAATQSVQSNTKQPKSSVRTLS